MHARPFSLLLIGITISMLAVGCASAQPHAQWAMLGERNVTDRAEFDAIHIGADRGRFVALKIAVSDAPVLIRRVVVHFGNGETLVREKNVRIGENRRSGTLDLPGGRRVVRKVVFYYEASSPGFERATIRLWGRR